MSACLFTVSPKWFRDASEQEIVEALEKWQAVRKRGEDGTDDLNGNKFNMDRYHGYGTNIERAIYTLMGVRKAK